MSDNGQYVSRAELAAHIRRIDESLTGIHTEMADINKRLATPGRWLGTRFTRLVDYALVGILASAIAVIVSHI